jgi:hypothetical protein
VIAVTRRPWLVVAVLVLIAISATTFARSGRAYRADDAFALAIDTDALPCAAPAIVPVREHVAIFVDAPPLLERVTASTTIISLAPKTSPPHCERRVF